MIKALMRGFFYVDFKVYTIYNIHITQFIKKEIRINECNRKN
jgi:hypothetical protein